MSYNEIEQNVASIINNWYNENDYSNLYTDNQEYIVSYDYKLDDYWKFHFINKKISKTVEKSFKTEILKLCKSTGSKSINELVTNHLSELKKSYEIVFGKGNKLNETSLILLHYPIKYNDTKCKLLTLPVLNMTFYYMFMLPLYNYVPAVSLLTGDAMIDDGIAKLIQTLVLDNLGIIQVPHHGSYPNWNALDTKLKRKNPIYIIPCKSSEKNLRTIKALTGTVFQKVTEFVGYPYWIEI